MRKRLAHPVEGRKAHAAPAPSEARGPHGRAARGSRAGAYDPELVEEVESLRRDPIVFETTSTDELMARLRRAGG